MLYAVNNDQLALAELLLENGSNLDIRNSETGSSSLHYAVNKRNIEMTRLLLKYKMTINVFDDNGVTPSSLAKQKGYLEISELLIENGADTAFLEMQN